MGQAEHRERATRYALECAFRFRESDTEWSDATLKNISASGLLFDTARHVADDARLEIRINLPAPGIGSIWCTARVVRREQGTGAIGARITDYLLQPRGGAVAG